MTKYSVPSFGGHVDFFDDVTIYPVLAMARTVVVSHHAKFQLITTTGSGFFLTVFVEILRPPLLALFWKLACELAEVTLEAHLKH